MKSDNIPLGNPIFQGGFLVLFHEILVGFISEWRPLALLAFLWPVDILVAFRKSLIFHDGFDPILLHLFDFLLLFGAPRETGYDFLGVKVFITGILIAAVVDITFHFILK